MGPVELIIGLTLFGFALLAVEVFLPGMVLAVLGSICLVGAIAVAFTQFGPLTGSLVLTAILVFVLVGFCVWMAIFPRTGIGRRVMMKHSLDRGASLGASSPESFPAESGTAVTALRPSGTALLGDRRVDVITDGEFVEPGEGVVVVRRDGRRVVVRKTTGGTAGAA